MTEFTIGYATGIIVCISIFAIARHYYNKQ